MKKFKETPFWENAFKSLKYADLILQNINSLNNSGIGLRVSEKILHSIDLYLCPINGENGKIGFINSYGEIVIKPIYDSFLLEFVDENSVIIVELNNKWGLMSSSGELIIPTTYDFHQSLFSNSNFFAFGNKNDGWSIFDFKGTQIIHFNRDFKRIQGVNSENLVLAECNGKRGELDLSGNIIVPFNFNWIDYDFFGGLARVIVYNGQEKKWGIINTKGEYVIDPIYDNIWKFSAGHKLTNAVLGKEIIKLDLADLRTNLNSLPENETENYNSSDDNFRRSTFEEFRGSYAQDVMGYDDETINDAFEGDPDAYWNID